MNRYSVLVDVDQTGGDAMNDIVKSVSVENLCNQRAAVVERILAAFAALNEARELASAANVGFPRIEINEPRYRERVGDITGDTGAAIKKIVDRGAWCYLMNESGMRTFMDQKAREKWDKSIEEGDFPELTDSNVRATFRMLYDARGDIFERGVIAVFKELSWDYRTNRPFAFGKRIVLTYVRSSITGGNGRKLGWMNYTKGDKLDDLSRVFSVLDGKPEPDHRTGWHGRIGKVETLDDPDAADAYMRVKCFRNGNAHVTFLRPDLVEKMNAILAKHYPGALAYDRAAA